VRPENAYSYPQNGLFWEFYPNMGGVSTCPRRHFTSYDLQIVKTDPLV